MKQSLDLRLGQHLTITPQLQQAIRLLQLSTIELQQEVREALESNPLLEEDDTDMRGDASAEGEDAAPAETATDSDAGDPADLDMEAGNFDGAGDTDWDDGYDGTGAG